MFRSHVLLAAAIALPISTGPAAAQEIGQPSRGLALAQRLCSECHAVEKQQRALPTGMRPVLPRSIALSAALNTSHHSMPNILLQPDEQADIIAYVLTLR